MSTSDITSVCPICGSPDVVHLCAAVMEANAMQSRNETNKQSATKTEKDEKSENVVKKFNDLVLSPDEETKQNGSEVHEETAEDSDCPKYVVIYLGNSTLDRRFPPKSAMTWVMAEVKHSRDTFKEVQLEVRKSTLVAMSYEGSETAIDTVFEHNLHTLSRFAKTHQDPRCFAYLRRQSLYSDFECHVFLAHDEKVMVKISLWPLTKSLVCEILP
ncbi:TBC1 domain member 4 [Mactra antiquata]